jgi:hypothetical protein
MDIIDNLMKGVCYFYRISLEYWQSSQSNEIWTNSISADYPDDSFCT